VISVVGPITSLALGGLFLLFSGQWAKPQTMSSRKRFVKRRDGPFICPRCGFEAARPPGLGRHGITELDRRYDRLLRGLKQLLRRSEAEVLTR